MTESLRETSTKTTNTSSLKNLVGASFRTDSIAPLLATLAGKQRTLVRKSTRLAVSSASLLPWMMNQGVDVAMTDYRTIEVVVGDDPYAWKGIDPPPHPVFLRPTGGAVNADELATDLRAADVADG